MIRAFSFVMIFLGFAATAANNALADGNWWWGGSPYGFNTINRSDREIPFYAQFPPVYYSHIVPRTYGQSPYAYWPGPFTPMIAPEPIMVPNPFIESVPEVVPAQPEPPKKRKTSTDKSAEVSSAHGPLVVLNPYVDQQPSVASNEK